MGAKSSVYTGQSTDAAAQVVNTVFWEPERGHTTEDYRTLWNNLEQLVRGGKLKQFLYHPNGQGGQARSGSQRDASSKPPLGTINVILAAQGRTGSHPFRVLFIAQPFTEDSSLEPKRIRMEVRPALSFSNEDKIGTMQPHNDALVVTLRIRGYDVKRVLVDQGFDEKVVVLMGQIRLPVQAGSEVVEVDFIVERPWLHAMGVASFTLHLKVKYPSGDMVEEVVGSQSMARQYLVAAIGH
ncbi:uncharacterized protein LOC142629007 [Castanea sativa]|uniref:uncharacterized protein LOC142629007 n=1 Tax=Castanea sativa TaxID=21020 RepID=UPI003F64C582